jgi:hypothetical protein
MPNRSRGGPQSPPRKSRNSAETTVPHCYSSALLTLGARMSADDHGPASENYGDKGLKRVVQVMARFAKKPPPN